MEHFKLESLVLRVIRSSNRISLDQPYSIVMFLRII